MWALTNRVAEALDRLAEREVLTGHRAAMALTGLVLGLLAVPAAALDGVEAVNPWIRFTVLFGFVCLGPGLALVSLVRLGDWVLSWAMAFVVSLALNGAVAAIMLWTRSWSPIDGFAALAFPTVAAAAMALARRWYRLATTAALLPWWYGAPEDSAAIARSADPPDPPDPPDPDRPGPRPSWLPPPVSSGPTAPRPRDPNDPFPQSLDGTALLQPIVDPVPGSVTWLAWHGQPTASLPSLGVRRPGQPVAPRPPADATELGATMIMPKAPGDDFTRVMPAAPPELQQTALVRLPKMVPERVSEPEPAVSTGETPPRPTAVAAVAEVAIAAGFLAIWLYGLVNTSTANVGEYGLLSVLHWAFFVAVGACVVRFVVELVTQSRPWVMVMQTGVLVLILHATMPLLVRQPEYSWTYKHVGVIEYIQARGEVTSATDVYQQWPTFFALVAALVDGSGVDTLRVAAWAPLFFDLAFCVPLYAIARTLTTDRRVPYLAVFLFSALNWVAQDYLSPQAFTYVLCLGTVLVLVRWLRRPAKPASNRTPGWLGQRLGRLWSWASTGLVDVPYTARHVSRTALLVLYLLFAVVVSSHQLSPYVIALCAVALVMLRLIRAWQVAPILLGIAVLYLVPRKEIADHYGLFSGFNLFQNVRSSAPIEGTSAARLLAADVAQFMALSVWGLAALAVITAWRRPGPIAIPAVLAFSPFVLMLGQAYGGEIIFRVYLFSLPWCCILIATLILRRRWVPLTLAAPAGDLTAVIVRPVSAPTDNSATSSTPARRWRRPNICTRTSSPAPTSCSSRTASRPGSCPTTTSSTGRHWSAEHPTGSFEITEAGRASFNQHFDPAEPTYLVFSPTMRNFVLVLRLHASRGNGIAPADDQQLARLAVVPQPGRCLHLPLHPPQGRSVGHGPVDVQVDLGRCRRVWTVGERRHRSTRPGSAGPVTSAPSAPPRTRWWSRLAVQREDQLARVHSTPTVCHCVKSTPFLNRVIRLTLSEPWKCRVELSWLRPFPLSSAMLTSGGHLSSYGQSSMT